MEAICKFPMFPLLANAIEMEDKNTNKENVSSALHHTETEFFLFFFFLEPAAVHMGVLSTLCSKYVSFQKYDYNGRPYVRFVVEMKSQSILTRVSGRV